MRDLSYFGTLRGDVHSHQFYLQIEKIMERHQKEEATCLTLVNQFSSVRHDTPHGSLIVAGRSFITTLEEVKEKQTHLNILALPRERRCFTITKI